jgi:hypothetical protein
VTRPHTACECVYSHFLPLILLLNTLPFAYTYRNTVYVIEHARHHIKHIDWLESLRIYILAYMLRHCCMHHTGICISLHATIMMHTPSCCLHIL